MFTLQCPRSGFVPDIYNSVAEKLNFTYTLQFSKDGGWGSIDKVSGLIWYGLIFGSFWSCSEWILEWRGEGHPWWSGWCGRSFLHSLLHKNNSSRFHSSSTGDNQYFLLEKSKSCLLMDKLHQAIQPVHLVNIDHHDQHLHLLLGHSCSSCQRKEHKGIWFREIFHLFLWRLLCFVSKKVGWSWSCLRIISSLQMEHHPSQHCSEDCLHHHLDLWEPHLLALEGGLDIKPFCCQIWTTIQLSWRAAKFKL